MKSVAERIKDVLIKHEIIFIASDGSYSEQSDDILEDLIEAAEEKL